MKKLKLLSLVLAMVMVLSFAFTGCGETSETPAAKYTYNAATSSLPTSWNSHTYQSNDATTVTGYTTDSLYTFDYNDAENGYQIVPSMATAFPTDVTANYVGKYGIEEGDTDRVYSIPLRDDLKFDNGDPITAATFVESMKLLLNPAATNYRADTYFKGNLAIHKSKDYAYNGLTVDQPAVDVEGYGPSIPDWTQAEGLAFSPSNVAAFANIFDETNMLNLAGYKSYFKVNGEDLYTKLVSYGGEDGTGKTAMNQEIFDTLKALFSEGAPLSPYWGWADEEIGYFTVAPYTYPEIDFSEVGFFADGNNLVVVNDNELSGFYLKYSLSTDFFLVHPETYKARMTVNQGIYANDYATSVDTYVGFGPYKLTTYVKDNTVEFTKNEHWYGYNLPENKGLYQTTDIKIVQVAESESRLNMFLQGKLDTYGLEEQDMKDYQASDHTYYTEGDSTWFVAINPSASGLKAAEDVAQANAPAGVEYDKEILTIKEFRQALSFSIDRAAYALALDPLGGVAKALYGNMIISDPDNGVAYRTTEEAKDVILKFWGMYDKVGEGKTYATKDEAIAAITGYDLAGAKDLFNQAVKKAKDMGYITTDNFKIHIVVGRPSEHEYYNKGYEHLKQVWTKAVEGTALEGKLEVVQSEVLGSSNFSKALKQNKVDVLFGVGWTGSALDPYGLMEVYVAPNYQYDPGWDTSSTQLDIEINGQVLRSSVYEWGALALAGKDIVANVVVDGEATDEEVNINAGANADMSVRLKILAAVEEAVLLQYDMIPLNLESSANLKGMQIKYYTEEYIFGVGRGGIKYMTYNYTDAEWDEYVKSKGGKLNYK